MSDATPIDGQTMATLADLWTALSTSNCNTTESRAQIIPAEV